MGEQIGILGGSFNPPHLGHLMMAMDALELARLDRVLFVPAATPPHKSNHNGMISAEHRLAMTKLAIADEPRFEVCDDEIRRGGISYTVETLRRLKSSRPDDELFLIIGGDTLRELPTWREIGAILDLCRVVTIARPGVNKIQMQPALPAPWPEKLMADVIAGHQMDVSSTDIRERIIRGRSIRYLVPDAVAAYIAAWKLFQA